MTGPLHWGDPAIDGLMAKPAAGGWEPSDAWLNQQLVAGSHLQGTANWATTSLLHLKRRGLARTHTL